MREKNTLARLEHIAHAEAQRRRINRNMVSPSRNPDTGEQQNDAPPRAVATRQAAAAVRNLLILWPEQTGTQEGREPHRHDPWVRSLALCVHGATKVQAARIMGTTPGAVDADLRCAYACLGVHDIIAASALWRARAQEEGYRMSEEDARAVRALHADDAPQTDEEPPEPLTPRQDEAMALLAQGIRRRDLPIAMGCTSGTIHSLLNTCYKKLRARGQRDAIVRYLAGRGHIGQPPLERPMAAGFHEVDLAEGSKAGGSSATDISPQRNLPP